MDRNLASTWQAFSILILDPIDASPVQRQEMRRAFYAGAAAMLDLTLKASECENEDLSVLIMDELQRELDQFNEDLSKGKA